MSTNALYRGMSVTDRESTGCSLIRNRRDSFSSTPVRNANELNIFLYLTGLFFDVDMGRLSVLSHV